jgi:hypothetical protein
VIFALASMLVAFLMLGDFLERASGYWSQWPTIEGFATCLAALVCSGLPYALILWNLRRGPSREKGLFQALTIGSFWFLFGTLLLIGFVFDQLGKPSSEMRRSAAEMFGMAMLTAGLFTFPSLLFLTGALRSLGALSMSFLASGKPSQSSGLLLDRIGIGATLVLFTFAAALSVFAVGPALDGLRSGLFEALVVCGLLPYGFVFQKLRRHGADREVLAFGCSLAIGCLTSCILGASVWGYMISSKQWHQHGLVEWGEPAFFTLLALSNVLVLRNILRLKRSSVTTPFEPLSWLSILVIPVTLAIFLFVLSLYSLSV